MALASAVQGATRPTQLITWTLSDGSPLNLAGATVTGRIRNLATNVTRDITGVMGVTDAAQGRFLWAYAPEDVAAAGRYEVQFTASFPDSPSPARTFIQAWTVEPSI